MPDRFNIKLWVHETSCRRWSPIVIVKKDPVQIVIEALSETDIERIVQGEFFEIQDQPFYINYTTVAWRKNIDILWRYGIISDDTQRNAIFQNKEMHSGDFISSCPVEPEPVEPRLGPVQLINFLDRYEKLLGGRRLTADTTDYIPTVFTSGVNKFNEWMAEWYDKIEIVEIKLVDDGVRVLFRSIISTEEGNRGDAENFL